MMPRMSNLEYAFRALDAIRAVIPLKSSDNKKLGGLNPAVARAFLNDNEAATPETLAALGSQLHGQKSTNLHQLRSNSANPMVGDKTRKRVIQYGKAARKAHVGNCLEYSCAVASWLDENKGPSFDLVWLGDGRDHVFVVIGQGDPLNGAYPTSLAAWDPQAAICDVWADIACLASDFPTRWKARMQNFAQIRMKLGGQDADGDTWYRAMDDAAKFSYLYP